MKIVLTVNRIRKSFSGELCKKSLFNSVIIFVPVYTAYWGSFIGIVLSENLWLKLFLSIINGILILMLFIIGHDACHQAFTPYKLLNDVLGRLALLVSYHPYSSWKYYHNQLHHSWTNLRTRDMIWAPYSVNEFKNLKPFRRFLERVYRTPLGLGLYYPLEIFFPHVLFPIKRRPSRLNSKTFEYDRLSVLLFFVLQMSFFIYEDADNIILLILLGNVLPQIIWNWLMSFIVYQHHTHPHVKWYQNSEKWSSFSGQVEGTIHVIYPRIIARFFMLNIMEHIAHHVDPRIPLYHLHDAQKQLNEKYSHLITSYNFSIPMFINIMKSCKLYDYDRQQWLDFDGIATTAIEK